MEIIIKNFFTISSYLGAEYWQERARKEIDQSTKVFESLNRNVAKNVIIFVGDGMSLPTLTAARIYKAQKDGRERGEKVNGEESLLFFETFPHVGLSKVNFCFQTEYVPIDVIYQVR
jgi:alkaline phosphatase